MHSLLRWLLPESEENRFARSVERTLALQRSGYDIGFSFAPRYGDVPLLHVCEGRYKDDRLTGIGFDCFSRSAAFTKALSETLERALWKDDMLFWNEHAITATPVELGAAAMDLSKLAGFSSAQQAAAPSLRFDSATKFLFSRAVRLATGAPVYVPAQLLSSAYAAGMAASEPLLRIPNSNGLATHETFGEAARRGLLELIERDAFMITFFHTISAPRIDPAGIRDARLHAVIADLLRTNFALDLVLLPTDMPLSVICAILRDQSGAGPALTIGARAHEDPEEAVLGALTEVLGVYHLARRAGLYKKELPPGPLGTLERIAYWGKPEHTDQLSWLWGGPLVKVPPRGGPLNARHLAREVEARGCSVAAIAMTPPKLAKLGLVSVCVVSAELQPLNLDEEPAYLGGERLATVPGMLGYTTKDGPPSYPHPFP